MEYIPVYELKCNLKHLRRSNFGLNLLVKENMDEDAEQYTR
jgi:hypothetical protein